jgi:competence protein ComGD
LGLVLKYLRKKQWGFTLIEMLIVLTIVMIITSITFLQLKPLVNQKHIDHFFEQFTDDLLLAQIFAMSHGQSVAIIFIESEPAYKIVANSKVLTRRTLPHMFSLKTASIGGQVFYRSNGGISKSGTLYITYGTRNFKIVFLLGEGRFYVSEI